MAGFSLELELILLGVIQHLKKIGSLPLYLLIQFEKEIRNSIYLCFYKEGQTSLCRGVPFRKDSALLQMVGGGLVKG